MKKDSTMYILLISAAVAVLIAVLAIAIASLLHRPIPDAVLEKIASDYAVSRCRADEKDNAFCDKLHIHVGNKDEDFAKVLWIVDVSKDGSNENDSYSGFIIDSNGGKPKVDESTYTLARPR